jgi:uncharacterized protein (DUF1499 family)
MMRRRRDRGETLEDAGRPPASLVASLGLVLAVLAALAALAAGPGHRFGLWPLGVSFALLQAGFWGSLAAAIVSAAGLIVARSRGRQRGMLRALAGLAIGLVVVGVLASFLRTATALPPIHDITTDPEDPPEFQAIVPLRVDAPNPIAYPGAEVAAQQEDAYPDVQPLLTGLAPEEAFARALEAAGELGWEVVAADRAEGRIEAVDTTFWFGFQDDVVVRIRPADPGSRIDVRSKSRVGVGDLGTNAARIRAYLDALSTRRPET